MSEPGQTGPSRWRALRALLAPDRRRWVVLGALVGAASGLAIAGPLVVRRIIDVATGGGTTSHLMRLAGLFLALAIAAQVLQMIAVWAATTTAWRTTNTIRVALARHVLRLDHEFHRTHTPGELIQRVDGDVTSVSDFLGQVVPKALGAVWVTGGIVLVLAVLDWRLAIGAAVYVSAAVLVLRIGRHRAVAEAQEEMSAMARLYGGIEERLTAAEDLRANGAAHHAMWRFQTESAGALETAVAREQAFMRLWWRLQSTVSAGTILALITGAVLVPRGSISLGTAFLLLQYVTLLERPLHDVIQQLEVVQKANGAMIRVLDLQAVEPTVLDGGVTSPPPGAMTIDFDDVSFHYGDDQQVLDDVSVRMIAGSTYGIVGRSGSGKTTLSRLVLRLVEPTSGTLRLGGVPIDEIPMNELRRRVALIPQEVELFGGTVRDNVTMFATGHDDWAVADALTRAGLGELAEHLDRPLAAGGAGLSAGEAQLISLARVWLRNPDVVVLDEATARVDPETESRLNAAVRDLRRGRTVMIIAHRLSTLRDVDGVVVVDDGRVVEHGPRAELAADPSSRFARLLRTGLEVPA